MWSKILLALLIWGGVGLLWILAFNVLGLKYDTADPEAEQVPGNS